MRHFYLRDDEHPRIAIAMMVLRGEETSQGKSGSQGCRVAALTEQQSPSAMSVFC
jgi:hypothetical protein